MKHHNQEFKRKVVSELRAGTSAPNLSRKYGVSTGSIYLWNKALPKSAAAPVATQPSADTDSLMKTVLQQREYITRLERVVLRHVVATN